MIHASQELIPTYPTTVMSITKTMQQGYQSGIAFADVIKPEADIRSQMVTVFYDQYYDIDSYYKRVEEIALKADIPMSIKETTLYFGAGGAGKRKYLRIKKGPFIYYVCASPYGNTFFFSYWLKQSSSFFARLMGSIPIVGKSWYQSLTKMNLYQADTYAVYRRVVEDAITQAMEECTKAGGIRKPEINTIPKVIETKGVQIQVKKEVQSDIPKREKPDPRIG